MLSADTGYMFAVEFIAANETELFNIKWYLRKAKKCFSFILAVLFVLRHLFSLWNAHHYFWWSFFSPWRLCAQCGIKSPDSNLDKNCRNTYAFQFTEKMAFSMRASPTAPHPHHICANTWRRRRIDAGDEHTICHDELSVASIINFSWHMR